MIDEALNKLDQLSATLKSEMMRNQSLVVTGQRMANLLKTINIEGTSYETKIESQELIRRWEKEFKNG